MRNFFHNLMAAILCVAIGICLSFSAFNGLMNDPFKAVAYVVLAWCVGKIGEIVLEDV